MAEFRSVGMGKDFGEALTSLTREEKYMILSYLENIFECWDFAKEYAVGEEYGLGWLDSILSRELMLRMGIGFHRVEVVRDVLVAFATGHQEEKDKDLGVRRGLARLRGDKA